MSIDLTIENVIEALKEAVAEKGEEYVYVNKYGQSALDDDGYPSGISCHYLDLDSNPSCIVGNVLYRLGVPFNEMYDNGEDSSALVKRLHQEGVISAVQLGVLPILYTAQGMQDMGATWGVVLEKAIAFDGNTD